MSFISDLISKSLSGAATGILQGASQIIKDLVADPTEKLKAEQALATLAATHEEAIQKLSNDLETAYIADTQNARAMQQTALNQADIFSKRYIYYLATVVIALVFVFDFGMFFLHYPPENRDMINMVAGVLNSTALVMVLSFFFGSSKSSQDKDKTIQKLSE